jgi:hypothetical protein
MPRRVDHSRLPELRGYIVVQRAIRGGTHFINELWIVIRYPDSEKNEPKMPARDFLFGCKEEGPFLQMQTFLARIKDANKRKLFLLPLHPNWAHVV